MQRLKFKEIAPGILESVYKYESSTTGALYEIIVDKNNFSYKIRNVGSGRIYINDKKTENLAVLYRHLRKRLKGLGVIFEEERHKSSK